MDYQVAEKNYQSKKNSNNKGDISKFENAFNDAKFSFDTFSEDVKKELVQFEKEFCHQIMDSIVKFSQFNKDMNNQSADVWKQFLSKIDI